ncbi:hypothetical protein [Ottowia sp.]|uniref:DUF968 domain-containing protein n=1 Tax=Ottowia sp. TaxID=1898956 RepID=UPI003A8C342D
MTYRSETYRRWVAAQPCIRCGREGASNHAHANSARFGKGMGLKADDRYAFPLCVDGPGYIGCHTKHDQHMHALLSKSDVIDLEALYIVRTLGLWLSKRGRATPELAEALATVLEDAK